MLEKGKTLIIERPEELMRVSTRRDFLRMLGVGGAVVLLPAVFTACSDKNTITGSGTGGNNGASPVTLNLSSDTGILNYAYVLEQLEAAFYSGVVTSSAFGSLSSEAQEVMVDLRNHEVIHREFLRAALGSNAVPSLSLDQSAVAATMTDAATILRSAEMFEDLGVAAYNGAGKYLSNADFLTAAGKIVSVEARHAAAIRDIRDALGVRGGDAPNTRFAGDTVVIPLGQANNGLGVKLEPSALLARVGSTNLVSNAITIGTGPSSGRPGTPDFGPPSPTP